MRTVFDEWINDIPHQFRGKENIEILIKAFARQMQELQQVFEEMNTKLDIGTATGQNLDYVGTIIPLTRKEAGELVGLGMSDPILSDERYTQILKYMLLRNTCECTYYDIMAGLQYLYNFRFSYREDPKYPATIILNMPLELDKPDIVFNRKLCIKPSGVMILGEKTFLPVVISVLVKYENQMTLLSSFYPRSNIPPFVLDGAVPLDGRYLLNGYMDDCLLDFYPASMQISGQLRQGAGVSGRFCPTFGTGVPVRGEIASFEVRGEGEVEESCEGCLHILVGVQGAVSAGGQLTVENDLWYMDGTEQLDGTRAMDADVFYYDL